LLPSSYYNTLQQGLPRHVPLSFNPTKQNFHFDLCCSLRATTTILSNIITFQQSRPQQRLLLLLLLPSAIMSGLQTPMSLAAQAAADAQAAAQAAAATQAAAAAQAAATTISTADFMKFLQAYKAPTKLATIDQPRAGGINATGAWTGSGSGQLGAEPFS
jgi:hypothetical protein